MPDLSALESALRSAVAQDRLLAGALGVVVEGRIVLRATAGVIRPLGPEANSSSLFEIGSIAKMLTAIAALRVVDSGALELGATASSVVPGLTFVDDRAEAATLRHLLTHSSGLPAAGRDWGPAGSDALLRFAQEDLSHHRLHAQPGETACYSSTAISLAGLMLETVTRSPFPALLRSEVVEPAGLADARLPPEADPASVVWPHHRRDDGWMAAPMLADNPTGYPSGFLLASLDDLLSLAETLLAGTLVDMYRLVTDPVSRWMAHAPSPLARISAGLGLGCFTGRWNGETVIRHPGAQLASRCSFDLFPESDSAVVVLTNGGDDETLMGLLALEYEAMLGAAATEEMPPEVPCEDTERLIGSYLDVDTGQMVVIAPRDDGLVLDDGAGAGPLTHLGAGAWVARIGKRSVPLGVPGGDKEPAHVTVWGQLFQRVEAQHWRPEQPADLTGLYRDGFWPHPSSDLVVETDEGDWYVTCDGDRSDARWIGPRRLVCDHGLLEFDSDGIALVLGNATRFAADA